MEMENMKKKSCNLWFSLPDMKVNLKQLSETALKKVMSETALKKVMSVKTNFLKKASVAKLYRSIRRYFVKQREIGLF